MDIINSQIDKYLTAWHGGPQLISGDRLQKLAIELMNYENGIQAGVGGTLAAAYPLKARYSIVNFVNNESDSVLLPFAIPGSIINVANITAKGITVYAQAENPHNGGLPDSIFPIASSTGVPSSGQSPFVSNIYYCIVKGQWVLFF